VSKEGVLCVCLRERPLKFSDVPFVEANGPFMLLAEPAGEVKPGATPLSFVSNWDSPFA
jgi:hypothetical protein